MLFIFNKLYRTHVKYPLSWINTLFGLLFPLFFFGIIAALTGKKSKIGPYWSFLIGAVLQCVGWLIVAWVRETYPKSVDNEQ